MSAELTPFLALLLSLGGTLVSVGIAWGTLSASVRELRRDIDTKASAEKVAGVEALMTVELKGVRAELSRLASEIHALRRERGDSTNPGRG